MSERTEVHETPGVLDDVPGRSARVVSAFREHFAGHGYRPHAPVPVTSRIDSSVRFVGSTISVLKPLLTEGVPDPGVFLIQRAVRTRNLRAVADGAPLDWASYFVALGTLSPAGRLPEIAVHAWELFRDRLPVDPGQVVIRASSLDPDLVAVVRGIPGGPAIEIDGYEEHRYRHRFGMEGYAGRNVNFAIDHPRWGLRDVGNLILIHRDGVPVAVELAFGVGTILSRAYGLDHPIQASSAGAAVPVRTPADIRLADMVSVAVVLLSEGLRPNGSGRGRILRGHLQALSRLRAEAGRSIADVERIAERFHALEFGTHTHLPEAVAHYLGVYEDALARGLPPPTVNETALRVFPSDERFR
ncbi:hypothetical protein [Actinoallomurus sp. CA-142502]|uniref:hypothetical protein n=1 Tax=Actinoallomurus sp. CA-142502 TaxID=3239885 RepID=UPI003D8CA108